MNIHDRERAPLKVVIGMLAVMLVGLFTPAVDNKEIFGIIGPAFQVTVGAFVGILSSRIRSKDGDEK